MSEWRDRQAAVIPGGANTLSKMPGRYGTATPAAIRSGRGAYVTDLDGRHFIDWTASLAAVTLGHAHPGIVRAMQTATALGGTFGLPSKRETSVTRRLLYTVGWPDGMCRWVSTGSEATEAAVRIARMATGRDRIVSIGYHSWHSTFTAAKPYRPGVPDAYASVITEVPYSDLEALYAVLERPEYDVAAVILEPTIMEPPAPGYLEKLTFLAHRVGALVIADEIVCGFRWHRQGAMLGTYGVRPDLACLGKAISNGAFPIACVVGSPELMRHAWAVSGTMNAHPIGLAAVDAVLDVYATEPDPITTVRRIGETLMREVEAAIAVTGAPFRWAGQPQHPVLVPTVDDAATARLLNTLLVQWLADAGVLWHPGGANPMTAHLGAPLTDTLTAFAHVLARIGSAWKADGDAAVRAELRGAPIEPAIAGRT